MRKFFISNWQGKTILAVTENQKTVEIIVCNKKIGKLGNIYKGIVKKSKEAMDTYFVQIGQNEDGFLLAKDCLVERLEHGEEIVVQVVKERSRFKSAKLTMKLSFPGVFLVYSPFADYVAASKKMSNNERDKWISFAENQKRGHEGFIIRTAASDSTLEEVERELKHLRQTSSRLLWESNHLHAPTLLHEGFDCIEQAFHNYISSGIDEVVTDDKDEYEKIKTLVEKIDNDHSSIVTFQTNLPINVENEIQLALKKVVWLPDGSYLLIEETESMTMIDVNSGKSRSGVMEINKQAAIEAMRQLRLRNLGGMIVIDFLRMKKEDEQLILQEVQRASSADRKTVKIFGFTRMGLFELTRKKIGGTLKENLEPATAAQIDNQFGSW
ncbi:hypothetical protein DCC39_10505 [Pueribacillus theae]|uniref:S1 motif domain-containing protein n=1 Tax=Pueribacillus theae TaxID=2171751 RepID=A0A2U1K0D5_9BACI|nr:ribonuclease E/G [Pueribacillus theae]PWA10715.1 hypothetical protein DCC39_10505 [Pueribacillus theae]